jgi:hypothetical protein
MYIFPFEATVPLVHSKSYNSTTAILVDKLHIDDISDEYNVSVSEYHTVSFPFSRCVRIDDVGLKIFQPAYPSH